MNWFTVLEHRANRTPDKPLAVFGDETVRGEFVDLPAPQRAPAQGLVSRDVDAFAQAQAHQQELVALLFLRERDVLDQAVALALDLREPHFRMFFGRLRAPRRADADAAVRARPDADIFSVAPIDKIVPAFRAGPGV